MAQSIASAVGLTWPTEDFSRVPYGIFTSQDVFEREQELIFRGRVWCYLALEAEVAEPGDYKTSFVGDTPVVVCRSTDGRLNAFVNRCAHRGTLLVRDLAGLLHQFQTTFGIYRNTQEGGSIFDQKRRHEVHYSTLDTDDEETISEGYDGVSAFNAEFTLEDPSLIDYHDEIGDNRAICMMSVFPNLMIQQLSNSLATRQIRPRGPSEFELYWTYFSFADDTPEIRAMRLRQINMVGPAGLVSMEDGEVGRLVQLGIRSEPEFHSVIEMGGTGPIENQDTPLTEVPVRGFWKNYCELMGYEATGGGT